MTGFAGYFLRGKPPAGFAAQAVKTALVKSLSRNPAHQVFSQEAEGFFLAKYDNGAWQDGRAFIPTTAGLAVVSGNPMIVGEDGVTNTPAHSAKLVADNLAPGSADILAQTAGSFVACHWDASACLLRLCADKLATRPLYYYLDADICLFSTTMRLLRQMSPTPFKISEQGFAETFVMGQCFGKTTLFENVHLVEPGQFIEITRLSDRAISYFRWDSLPPAQLEGDALVGRLHDLFARAVRRRLQLGSKVDAFLSGGMDSRSVVAALVDAGASVRAFNYSYKGSADAVLGAMTAKALGVELVSHTSRPEGKLKHALDQTMNVNQHFPRHEKDPGRARLIWTGDGGSVGMGHVYMDTDNVSRAAAAIDDDTVATLFPRVLKPGARAVKRSTQAALRARVRQSLRAQLAGINPGQADRRMFLYFLLNDQARHLYDHYEYVDLYNIEYETPFFDMDFLAQIVASPTAPFLYHKLYNSFMQRFRCAAMATPWQPYPGHEPGPLPMPGGILGQWETLWYVGKIGSEVASEALDTILKDPDPRLWQYFDRTILRLVRLFNRVGFYRYNYEAHTAHQLYEQISGEKVFPA